MSNPANDAGRATEFSRYSQLAEGRHDECLRACRDMTDAVYEGLDVEREIRAVEAQGLYGPVWDAAQLVALGVCRCGGGSEAGGDACYINFGAARSELSFEALLDSCEPSHQKTLSAS